MTARLIPLHDLHEVMHVSTGLVPAVFVRYVDADRLRAMQRQQPCTCHLAAPCPTCRAWAETFEAWRLRGAA